jgi:carbamoyltransferase
MISPNLPIVSIWGMQDGSDRTKEGWSAFCPTHDHGFCILEDGEIKYAIETERITREKHDVSLSKMIEGYFDLFPNEFIAVSVNHHIGNSFISSNGLWRTECNTFDAEELIVSAHSFIKRKTRESYVCAHEIAHIGACLPFYGDFLPNSLLIHVDGLASTSSESVYYYDGTTIQLIHKGFVLLPVAQLFGYNDLTTSMFVDNIDHRLAVPGKLMGYSSYGKYEEAIMDVLERNDFFPDFLLNPNRFFQEFNETCIDLRNTVFMDIAACIQSHFQESIMSFVSKYRELTKAQHLYFSGGCALNIKLNAEIVKRKLFENVFVPPCCSDTGLAIGAASIVNFLRGGKMSPQSPYVNNIGLTTEISTKFPTHSIIEKSVEIIASGEPLAICVGAAECGPRGLCHRSIVGLPTVKMFKKISIDMKKREWYRPIAPVCTKAEADIIFEDSIANDELTKYMLTERMVKAQYRTMLSGIIHVDGTVRPQIIDSNNKELQFMYQILELLQKKHGILCLINTSFNRKNEPIVHTIDDARVTAKEMGIRYLLTNCEIEFLLGVMQYE